MRQFLTESSLVAFIGGIVGLILAVVGMQAFLSVAPPFMPRLHEIGLNPRVVIFTVGISLLTGFIFGLTPAFHALRMNLSSALRNNRRGGAPRRIPRIRKALVISEIALALTLLVASGLLMQGYWRLRVADMDLDASDILTFEIDLPESSYPDQRATTAFYEDFQTRLERLPGIQGVGAVSLLPSKSNTATYYSTPGEETNQSGQELVSGYRFILPGYFNALDIPMVRGREFTRDDRKDTLRSLVINETMARQHWPGEDPVGQEILIGENALRIIGVAADSRDGPLDDIIRPKIYLSALQSHRLSLYWIVETTRPHAPLVESIRSELAAIDTDLPIFNILSLDEHIGIDLGGDLIMAKIMVVLAGIALLLCLGGVHGVMAYSVSQQNREMGIRMALGAREGDVVRMIVRQGSRLALTGIIIGLVLAAGVSSGLSHFLWGVSPFHPVTFASVTAVLFATTLAATFFPARRATRVDPIVALRSD
jgi:predicted permease